MAKKLHQRFARVEAWDRESFRCGSCEKVRAMCRECGKCSECCACEYCHLCGLPDGWLNRECECFQCEDCHNTFPEDKQVIDDGDYTTECFNPMKPLRYLCEGCWEKRKKTYLSS